jgi:hypothetical protein
MTGVLSAESRLYPNQAPNRKEPGNLQVSKRNDPVVATVRFVLVLFIVLDVLAVIGALLLSVSLGAAGVRGVLDLLFHVITRSAPSTGFGR